MAADVVITKAEMAGAAVAVYPVCTRRALVGAALSAMAKAKALTAAAVAAVLMQQVMGPSIAQGNRQCEAGVRWLRASVRL